MQTDDDWFDAEQEPWRTEGISCAVWFEREFPRLVQPTAKILSGARLHSFEAIPNGGGIYFLIDHCDRRRQIVYVGVSGCFRDRLQDHEVDKVFTHTYFITGIPVRYWGEIECFYIESLRPELNIQRGRASGYSHSELLRILAANQ
jgi:hypothetical protein